MVYVLVDKAGNISRLSKPRSVTVALGTMPANLQAPLVPLADDGLVDRLDAVQGVKVHVLEYENWKQTDEVSVSWAGSLVGRRQIGEGETFPLVFSVSLDVLRHEYGDPPVGTKAMPVSYTVFRGGSPAVIRTLLLMPISKRSGLWRQTLIPTRNGPTRLTRGCLYAMCLARDRWRLISCFPNMTNRMPH